MRLRPVDQNGDVLPVLHASDMFSGSLAVAKLVEDRLNLFSGDWWENPSWGNEILRMMQEGRLTETDAQSLSTYLASYVRNTSGVKRNTERKVGSFRQPVFVELYCDHGIWENRYTL